MKLCLKQAEVAKSRRKIKVKCVKLILGFLEMNVTYDRREIHFDLVKVPIFHIRVSRFDAA